MGKVNAASGTFRRMNNRFTRSEILKRLYAAQLLRLQRPWVREFWEAHSLSLAAGNRRLEGPDLAEFLWREDGVVPVTYVSEIMQSLEPWFAGKGLDLREFLDFLCLRLGKGAPYSRRFLLSSLYPLLGRFFTCDDARTLLLDSLPLLLDEAAPGFRFGLVARRSAPGWTRSVHALHLAPAVQEREGLDLELLATPFARYLPRIIGMPAYEQVRILAGPADPRRVIWSHPARLDSERLEIGHRVFGHTEPLSQWCRRRGCDFRKLGCKDVPVTVMDRNYICPLRRRLVLRAGHAYRAPLALLEFRYRSNLPKPPGFLQDFILEAVEDGKGLMAKAERLHRELVETWREKLDIVFDPRARRITVDGLPLVKSIPAVILARILRDASEERTEFEFREFLADPEVNPNPINPNFVLRLKRLRETLDRKCPDLQIRPARPGSFRFIPRRPFAYREA